jgi:cytidylate kinase
MSTDANPSNRILAIDGPAGAGKSTIAGRMAVRFGLLNLETGAMYRAFGLKALRSGISVGDSEALQHLSRSTQLDLVPGERGSRVLLDGVDVTLAVRSPEVSDAASRVSVHGPVRAWMVGLQQALGRAVAGGIVMEGRDIGTVVFPEASLKIFLVASAEARAERRVAQDGAADASADLGAVLAALRDRDQRDQSRAESPLRAAEDAVTLDSTELSLDAVTERVAELVRLRWGVPG